jgi:hypothetical protein
MADYEPPAPKVQQQDLKGKAAIITYAYLPYELQMFRSNCFCISISARNMPLYAVTLLSIQHDYNPEFVLELLYSSSLVMHFPKNIPLTFPLLF